MDDILISNRSLAARQRWKRVRDKTVQDAREEFSRHIGNPLFTAGISLYWGEGDSKPHNPLRLSNTDARMISVYTTFIRQLLMVENKKIRLGLVLYPDLVDSECKKFWGMATGLTIENFVKTQYIKGRHPTKRLSHGICMVVVNSRAAKLKMLTWIDIFSELYTIVR